MSGSKNSGKGKREKRYFLYYRHGGSDLVLYVPGLEKSDPGKSKLADLSLDEISVQHLHHAEQVFFTSFGGKKPPQTLKEMGDKPGKREFARQRLTLHKSKSL